MKPELEKLCEDFIANRDVVKKTFRWDNASCYPVCANVLCAYGITADPDRLKECRDVVKKHTRPFSKFRGQVKPILSCMLAHGEDPDARMDLANDYYRLLKRKFRKSEYLVLAAFLAADLADRSLTEETAARGKEIFRLMNRNHRILTNKTDSVSAVLMAFSGKTDNELIDGMEACYKVLKTRFSGSAAQPAAQVLSMVSGTPEEKAQRVIEFYDALQEAGVNYGRSAEIAPLAALSVSGKAGKQKGRGEKGPGAAGSHDRLRSVREHGVREHDSYDRRPGYHDREEAFCPCDHCLAVGAVPVRGSRRHQ